MKAETGYWDLNKPFDDANMYRHPDAGRKILQPITRVIPATGTPTPSAATIPTQLLTSVCRGYTDQQPLTEAQRLCTGSKRKEHHG